MKKINDQFQFVHYFVISNLRLIAGLNQGLKPRNDQFRGAATKYGLFTEQVGFSFFLKRRFDYTGSRAADASGVGECNIQCIARCVLMYGNQAGNAVAFFVLPTNQTARSFGRD